MRISICEVLSSIHFCQTSSVFSDPLDLLDHPLLLDIFSLGAPQLRTGLGFLFFFKVSFEKHPTVQAFTLHRWAATKLPNLVSFPELTVDPSILKQVTRNEMSRSFIQTLTGASSLRNLRRDDHIQQPLPPPRWRILLLHRTESDHRLQRFAHIFHSRPEDESCSCVLLCRHPRWLLSWG